MATTLVSATLVSRMKLFINLREYEIFPFFFMSLPTFRIPQLQDQSSLLEPYFVQKDLLRELILQLKKDFASAGVPVKLLLTRKYTFDELCETLQLAFRDKTAHLNSGLYFLHFLLFFT